MRAPDSGDTIEASEARKLNHKDELSALRMQVSELFQQTQACQRWSATTSAQSRDCDCDCAEVVARWA